MKQRSADEIARWLVGAVARHAGVAETSVDSQRSFADYGLKSADAVALSGELGSWLGVEVSPALLYDHSCAHDLAAHLAQPPSAASQLGSLGQQATLPRGEPIAIVGMSCRVPGAADLAQFWQLLRDGVDAISEVPADRWSLERYYDPELSHPDAMNTKWGGFIGDVSGFDCEYFGISPLEAESMDPQQRLLLELAGEAFEDAGMDPARLRASPTSVFVGISGNDYERRHRGRAIGSDVFFTTSNALSIAANRISYVFDLRGASLAIDTACSSSLVAVHQACLSLQSGESTLALVGGVNLMLSPDLTISFSQAGATSRDGRCRAFDAAASGIVRGEGGAMLVLKPLALALADRDRVYAVIRASAVNQDGRTNGLSAPSGVAQRAVLSEAYARSGIAAHDVQYVEAHGTGTKLGDPIEAAALGAVLGRGRAAENRLAVGSVKSNIGHLEAAAGVVSLVKVALALQHRELPPSLHFERPNPHVDFAGLGLGVQTKLSAWPRGANGRVAGVSAFGFGGTNAHVVLKEGPSARRAASELQRPGVALLSARTPEALRQRAAELARYCEADGSSSPLDVSYTLARGAQHALRAAVSHGSREELVRGLQALACSTAAPTPRSPIVFVFSGHGAHWWGMGRELCAAVPLFRERLEACAQALLQHSSWDICRELERDEAASRIGLDLELTQLATFAIQSALADTWKCLGVRPAVVLGHSLGEVAAAYAAEILTLDQAARVVSLRSQEMARGLASAAPGAMALVRLAPEEAAIVLQGHEAKVSLAAHNAPKSVVLSGEKAALLEIVDVLRERRTAVRLVDTPGAGHSPAVDPAVAPLIEKLAGLQPSSGQVPMFSSVTGALVAGEELDARYWGRNLRQPVQFVAVVEAVCRELPQATWLELSAHATLGASIEQTLRRSGRRETVLASLKREREAGAWFDALGGLYEAGAAPKAARLFESLGGRLGNLPTYAWQRQRHWLAAVEPRRATPRAERCAAPGELGSRVDLPSPGRPALWDAILLEHTGLACFELAGRRLASLSALLELVTRAHREYRGGPFKQLAHVRAERPLYLDARDSTRLSLLFWEMESGMACFELCLRLPAPHSETGGAKLPLLRGEVRSDPSDVVVTADATPERAAVGLSAARCADLCSHALLQLDPPRLLSGWQVLCVNDATATSDVIVHVALGDEQSEACLELRSPSGKLLASMSGPHYLSVDAQLASAASPVVTAPRASEIEARLLARIGEVLGVPSASIDAAEPLSNLGIDSMTALQLKNSLERELGISLPLAKLLEAPTIRELSAWAAQYGQPIASAVAAELPAAANAEVDLMLAGIEQLSSDELDALLGSLLDEIDPASGPS